MKSSVHASAHAYSGKSYKIGGQTQTMKPVDPCCDEQYPGLQGNYRSFQQPVLPLPSTRYCDSVAPNEPNPYVLKEVMKDLSCVIDKTYGSNALLESRNRELEIEIERLRKDLKCCECCKTEIQNELLKLQADFSQAQYTIDELAESKASLEVLLTQLRSQVARQEETLDCMSQEKAGFLATVQDLEMKVKNYGDSLCQVQAERDDVIGRWQQLQDHQNTSALRNNVKMADLEDSLVRCCHQNESFQVEINSLRTELMEIRAKVENLEYEKRRILSEFEFAKNTWFNEKASMECVITDLQRKLKFCEDQKKDICQKLNEIVAEHHCEMDKLSEDAAKYKALCDSMNEELETLRKKLKDCEEQKRNNSQQQGMLPNNETMAYPGNYNTNNSPSKGQYYPTSGDCNDEIQDLKSNLYIANNTATNLEKDLATANNKSATLEKDLTTANNKSATLEKDLATANDKVVNLEEDLLDANTKSANLGKDLLNANLKAANLGKELINANSKAANLERELEEIKIQAENFEETLDASNDKADNLEKSVNISNNKVANLEKELNKAKTKAEGLERDLEDAKTEAENLEQDLENANIKSVRLEKELSTVSIKADGLEKRLEAANLKISHLEEGLQNSQRLIDNDDTAADQNPDLELQRVINSQKVLEAELTNLQGEVVRYKNAYATAQEKIKGLQQEIKIASRSLEEEKKQSEGWDTFNKNDDKSQIDLETVKREYEELLELANFDVAKFKDLSEKAELKVVEAIAAQKQAELKYNNLLKSAEDMEGKLGHLNPVASEAEFYKKEATRMQKELKDREVRVTELTRDLKFVTENLQRNEDSILTEALNKDQSLVYYDYQISDLREKLKTVEIEKGRLREIIKNLEERIRFVQPRLDVAFEERKSLEEKLIVLAEENKRLLKVAEEDRHNKDLFQRKLKDSQKLWESEVKAKGILTDKIANYERMNNQAEARNQQDSVEVEKWKDKFRALRSELKSERELVAKLRHKFDLAKEQWRIFKEQMDKDSRASDPKIRKLQNHIEEQKSQYEEHISRLKNDREHLLSEIFRLGQSNDSLKRELRKLTEEIQLYDAEKTTLENIVKSKDRLEVEVKNLKRAIDDQYVDKTELERLKATYDMQIATVKSQYEQQVQLGIDRKYSEITQIMDKQVKDRMMIDQIRESNENILRTELSTTKKSSQMEINNLKRLIREQEEQIKSEISSRRLITEKFSVEKKRNDDLLRKLSLLSTERSETLLGYNNNNIEET